MPSLISGFAVDATITHPLLYMKRVYTERIAHITLLNVRLCVLYLCVQLRMNGEVGCAQGVVMKIRI